MANEAIYAIGELGGPVRLLLEGEKKAAFDAKNPSEVVCLLNYKPKTPHMILADGSDVVPVPLSVDEIKTYMTDWVKAKRTMVMNGGCMTSKGVIQTDDASRLNIAGAASMASIAKAANLPFSTTWRMADNTYQVFDADTMISVAFAVGKFVADVYATSFATLDAIVAETSETNLLAMNLGKTQWPN